MSTQERPQPDPHVQVVRGTPDDVELAALVAGLVAATAGRAEPDDVADAPERAARTRWVAAATTRSAASLPARGPDAWRWSLHR